MKSHNLIHWAQNTTRHETHNLLEEEPLSIRIQGKPYAVIMRTPGDEINHTAGFCFGEGIINDREDMLNIAYCDGSDTNVVTVMLKPSRLPLISEHLERRNYISQSACGLCGKQMVSELFQIIKPISTNNSIDIQDALHYLKNISKYQPLRKQTRTTHGAVLFQADFKLLTAAEDVGRHNALDKVVGNVLMQDKLSLVNTLTLSSRISYEMVQKAARARIPIILALSRPTALAVQLGVRLNMSLATYAKPDGLLIYCGSHRFRGLSK